MSIIFNDIPANIRVPFFAAEFDGRDAISGLQSQRYKSLLIGQMLPSGNAETLKPYRVIDKHDAAKLFGAGSMLAESVDYYRRVDKTTEMLAIALPDAPAAARATAQIAVSGMASSSGALYLYINGVRLVAAVASGADASTVHGTIADLVNNAVDLPVSATATDSNVTLTFDHPGEAGNGLDVRFNYYTGEFFPVGLAATISPFSGGTVNPDVGDALATVMGVWFNALVCPYLDGANLAVIQEELIRRFGPLVQQEAWMFGALRGRHGELMAFGENRNNKHEVIMHCHGIPSSPWSVAASAAANAMYYGNIDPARPFQTLTMTGIMAPAPEDTFSDFPENNQLLYNGISTFVVGDDQTVTIGRLITTYKKNATGADDEAYLDLNTGLTLGYLRLSFREYFQRKYPRCKLGNDGVLYDDGNIIMTPKLAKAECIAVFREWEKAGLVEDADQFKKDLVVQRSATGRNRLEFLLSPDLINQLIVNAAQIRFRL